MHNYFDFPLVIFGDFRSFLFVLDNLDVLNAQQNSNHRIFWEYYLIETIYSQLLLKDQWKNK